MDEMNDLVFGEGIHINKLCFILTKTVHTKNILL